jgi:hypothetical protein
MGTPRWKSKKGIRKKLATFGTQETDQRQTKQKTHHYTQTKSNKVNKT